MKKYKYMHTMDREPATYDGDQIVFGTPAYPVTLVPTLEDIRRQRRKSRKWRAGCGFSENVTYGHIRVIV